ncbi:hypothetical protein RSK20926_00925 [Roseobacter sp. SK209-2-6]|nr:hypothetical protein RSK20926_00925 [Roseobacter sp. SK209-2-6]
MLLFQQLGELTFQIELDGGFLWVEPGMQRFSVGKPMPNLRPPVYAAVRSSTLHVLFLNDDPWRDIDVCFYFSVVFLVAGVGFEPTTFRL